MLNKFLGAGAAGMAAMFCVASIAMAAEPSGDAPREEAVAVDAVNSVPAGGARGSEVPVSPPGDAVATAPDGTAAGRDGDVPAEGGAAGGSQPEPQPSGAGGDPEDGEPAADVEPGNAGSGLPGDGGAAPDAGTGDAVADDAVGPGTGGRQEYGPVAVEPEGTGQSAAGQDGETPSAEGGGTASSAQADGPRLLAAASQPAGGESRTEEAKPGIEVVNGRYYYRGPLDDSVEGMRLVEVDGNLYLAGKTGAVATSTRRRIDAPAAGGYVKPGRYYLFDSRGRLLRTPGICKTDTGWYYLDRDGAVVSDQAIKVGGVYYLADGNGCLIRDAIREISSSQVASGLKAGRYYIDSKGVVQFSSKTGVLKEAIDDYVHVVAVGKSNSVSLTVSYRGFGYGVNGFIAQAMTVKGKRLLPSSVCKSVKLGANGKVTLTLTGLAPGRDYRIQVTPYLETKYSSGGFSRSYYGHGTTVGSVRTASRNACRAYKGKTVLAKIARNLAKRKSTGTVFMQIGRADYRRLEKDPHAWYVEDRLLADGTSVLGSLLGSFLKFEVSQGDIWKKGSKYYVAVSVKSRSSAKQAKAYRKMLKWFDKAKKATLKAKKGKARYKAAAAYLMSRCSYDYAAYRSDDPSFHGWCYDPRGPVFHRKAVCAGYTDTFRLMCLYAGLKCETIRNDSHSWNLVKVGRKWYHYDVTWNDCEGSSRKYSFLGRSAIRQVASHGGIWAGKSFWRKHPVALRSLSW